MKSNPNSLMKFSFLFTPHQIFHLFLGNPVKRCSFFFIGTTHATYSTICQAQDKNDREEGLEQPKDPIQLLRKWGCDDNDLVKILSRRPSLRNADLTYLQPKLSLLQGLGIKSADLVKIINCRPRLLSCRINHSFDERLEYFMTLFGSKEMLLRAIIRNPSLLTYDLHNNIKPVVALYEKIGVSRKDLIPMLLSRPTLIPRTTFDHQKLDYIHKTGVAKNSKMYKYVVTLIGISKLATIREKVANFEKFGFSDEEIWRFFGRSPLLLTLSVDKVQRNMTFIVGTMKLPANAVLKYPYLLYNNLETVLKPRLVLAGKIKDMNLRPQIKGPLLMRAIRMKEKRFLEKFVLCHPTDVAEQLMDLYKQTKDCKRLAESSKKNVAKGFPF